MNNQEFQKELKAVLEATATMDGLEIKGNNYKVSKFLKQREVILELARRKCSPFEFSLNQEVKIKCSGETGEVTQRLERENKSQAYYVRYRAADGRAVEEWWDSTALIAC